MRAVCALRKPPLGVAGEERNGSSLHPGLGLDLDMLDCVEFEELVTSFRS